MSSRAETGLREFTRTALGAALLACAVGCGIPDEGPSMRPGEDCLSCHNGERAEAWTIAGTVVSDPNAPPDAAIEGAQVIVTDANKTTLTLTTNSAGNFYTAEALAFPIAVQIQRGTWRMAMASSPSSGSCNTCHTPGNGDGAPGRLFIPYQQLSRKPLR